jgi:hypothetical protein
MSSETYADVREMYMAHTMFRREFGLLPALISGVRIGDVTRLATLHLCVASWADCLWSAGPGEDPPVGRTRPNLVSMHAMGCLEAPSHEIGA